MPSEHAQQALDILRDPSLFQWYVIPLLAIVTYIYASEIHARRWNVVFCGLAFWGADWINEIANSLFFHLNGYAPLWAAPGGTAHLVLVGLNVEIMFMFSIAGVAWAKFLPANRGLKIAGMPNRWFIAIAGAAFCVLVEIWLNFIGALTWDWGWWSASTPWLIFIFGYLWFFLLAFWVHDLDTTRKQARAVGLLWVIVVVLALVFGPGLGWL